MNTLIVVPMVAAAAAAILVILAEIAAGRAPSSDIADADPEVQELLRNSRRLPTVSAEMQDKKTA
jgi:hypothetical protein